MYCTNLVKVMTTRINNNEEKLSSGGASVYFKKQLQNAILGLNLSFEI